jgi:cytochrome oxidase assembly protein ShyY1
MSGSSFSFLLRPAWIAFHLLVSVGVVLMIWLGFWQLDRLDERQAFNATVEARIDLPPVPLDELLVTVTDPANLEWRQVTVAGEFQPQQVVWFNRAQDGQVGDNVLAALDLAALPDQDVAADGESPVVIVNRGFVTFGSEPNAAPTGEVSVLGRVRVPVERQLGGLTDAGNGPVTEVRRVDLEQLDAQINGDVASFYIDLIGSVPNVTSTDPIPVPAPMLSSGPHLSYAVQWFIFAASVLLGWVLAVRRSIRTNRRHALTGAGVETAPPDSDQPNDVEAASSTTGTGVPSPR